MKPFYNQVAFITGAASGIGRELAVQLARQGATVIVTDVSQAGAELVADAIRQRGGKADSYRLDVTDCYAVRLLIRRIQDDYDRIDYAFCNAEIGLAGPVCDLKMEDWERALTVNLNGMICTATEMYKVMVKQGAGHIVTTASPAGVTHPASMVPYLTTRHAIMAFSQALRQEGQQLGVNVTAFCPEVGPTILPDYRLFTTALHPEMISFDQPAPVSVEMTVEQLLKRVAASQELGEIPLYGKLMAWMNRFTTPFGRPDSDDDADSTDIRSVASRQEPEPETR